jgi:voltage-gated potassium channel
MLGWISPTYGYSTRSYERAYGSKVKGKGNAEKKGEQIQWHNIGFFCLSLISLGLVELADQINSSEGYSSNILLYVLFGVYVWLLPLARCIEMSIAFVRDALDRFDAKISTSALTYRQRLRMAFFSYGEVIVDFAIIYFLLPARFFTFPKDQSGFSSVLEAVYFSGVTIATIGYGDISPNHWITQLLVLYEVFCGLALLLVAFAVYTSQGLWEAQRRTELMAEGKTANSGGNTTEESRA